MFMIFKPILIMGHSRKTKVLKRKKNYCKCIKLIYLMWVKYVRNKSGNIKESFYDSFCC